MAILPRYQRIGLQTRQPQQMDFAATREQARLGQTISQQVDRMSDFAFKQAAQAAELRGQERVREEGALPTLEALREAGGPTTIAERAASDAANRIAVVEIESLAKQDMQNLVRDADKNNMSMSAFQASIADIQDGYAASMQAVDPVAAGVLSARLGDSAMTYQGRYSDISFKKAQAAAAENVKKVAEIRSQEIIDAATQPGVTQEDLQKLGDSLAADLQDIGASEEKSINYTDATLSKALEFNRIFRFDEAPIGQKRILLEEYEKNPLPGFDFKQNRSFVARLQGDLDREINKGKNQFVTDLSNAEAALRQRGTPPPGFEIDEQYIRDLFGDEGAEEIFSDWAQTQENVLNTGAVGFLSPDLIDEISLDYETAANNAKTPDEILKADAALLAWQQSLEQRDNAIAQDGALYVLTTNDAAQGVYEDIQDKLNVGDLAGAAQGLLQMREIAQSQYDDMNTPMGFRNVMPKPFAGAVVNLIQSQPTETAATTFEALRISLGDYSAGFTEELRRAGLKPEYVQALYTDNADTRQDLAEIAALSEKDIFGTMAPTDKNDIKTEVRLILEGSDYTEAFLGGSAGEARSIYLQQYETVVKLAGYKFQEGNITLQEAVKNSVAELLPEADPKQIVNRKQGLYIVPVDPTLNPSTIDRNMQRLLTENALRFLEVETIDFPDLPEFADEPVTLAGISSNGIWLNNETGDGLRLHYNINDRFVVVKKADGSNVDVLFKDVNIIAKQVFPRISAEERREARTGPAPQVEVELVTPVEEPRVSRREGRK